MNDLIREQYETTPYLNYPVEHSAKNDLNALYAHTLAVPFYYKNKQVTDTQPMLVLDAGCGTGYKSLLLAQANPGISLVGIDISPRSIEVAQQRLRHHGFTQMEFYTLGLEEVSQLGLQFDYINCDEVLYLMPDPQAALTALSQVLKPGGILRANLHSFHQRQRYFRAQELFRLGGLMESAPAQKEALAVENFMESLRNDVDLKIHAWQTDEKTDWGWILVNHLLQGDKGFTIVQMFELLAAANLNWLGMVSWQDWDLDKLFGDTLSPQWQAQLKTLTPHQRLHMYDVLHPIHRLLDFWCTPGEPVAK